MNKSNSVIVLIVLLFAVTSCLQKTKTKVPPEEEMKAYLMVYFKDSDHCLHMALSNDGYSFTDINKGNHVIAGDSIARQKGIRDPHIMRGPDNMFYIAMTDLHIYAKQAGFRTTEWERPREDYGWGNNKGFVLMKSPDLIHWSHVSVNIDEFFQDYDSIGCAWAPQTIWDDEVGKPMIYYSMRFKNGKTRLYYTYTNTEFTELETEPQLLFQYPVDSSYIDADITKIGDQFHMFYVAHDQTPGIKQAISDSINSGYVYHHEWIDPEPTSCEAPNIWKRIGEEKWVLMYDIYGIHTHNFGFEETLDFKNFTDLGHFNKGVMKATNFEIPKHGAVIHLTKDEAEKLCEHWGLEMSFDKL